MPRPASSPSEVPVTVDRAGGERDDETLLERVLSDPATLVLAIRRDVAPLRDGRLAFISTAQVPAEHVQEWAFLGRTADGTAVVLAALTDDAPADVVPDADGAPLRAAGGDLPDGEAELLTTAVALAGWLRDAAFCPACGSATELRHAGWSRHCPVCGREHFPRTDPAVIVLVTSATSDDRILLGANAAWGGDRYSCFAGFAEAGESLEDAVAREVGEEAGVRLRDIAYRGSQAWPYPRSLMLGFRAVVVDDAEAQADGEEIVEVRWLDSDEIGTALRGEGSAMLPGPASIARRLIDDWYRGIA